LRDAWRSLVSAVAYLIEAIQAAATDARLRAVRRDLPAPGRRQPRHPHAPGRPRRAAGRADPHRQAAAERLDHRRQRHLPYDLAVTAILLRADQLAPEQVVLASDGPWQHDWEAPTNC
jgi:hypothetical protein